MSNGWSATSVGSGLGSWFAEEEREWLTSDRVDTLALPPAPIKSKGNAMAAQYDTNQLTNPDYAVPMVYQDGGMFPANIFAPPQTAPIPGGGFQYTRPRGPINEDGVPVKENSAANGTSGVYANGLLNDSQHVCLMKQISSKEDCYITRCPRTGAYVPKDCPPPGCEGLWLYLRASYGLSARELIEYYIVHRTDWIVGASTAQEEARQASRPDVVAAAAAKKSAAKKTLLVPKAEEKKTNWLIWGGVAAAAYYLFRG